MPLMSCQLTADQDDNTASKYDLPPPSTKGAIPLPSPTTPGKANADGRFLADEEDHWERVGGPPRFGQAEAMDEDETTMLDHQTWLEGKLEDKYYGGEFQYSGVVL